MKSAAVAAMPVLDWRSRPFNALDARETYGIARLRQDVFVVEQKCAYPDLDGLDPRCLHLMAWQGEVPVAYLRVVPPEAHPSGCPSLGRICTAVNARRFGVGRELVRRGLEIVEETWPGMACQIGAQSYLRAFYESFSFAVNGEAYDEDGIPHFPMRRPAPFMRS